MVFARAGRVISYIRLPSISYTKQDTCVFGADAHQPVEDTATSELTLEEEDEDRHNFVQARDGAKLVAANKEAKKAAAVLDSDGDTFCKNDCKADKWYIFELSQVAKVDTLELSQVTNLPV